MINDHLLGYSLSLELTHSLLIWLVSALFRLGFIQTNSGIFLHCAATPVSLWPTQTGTLKKLDAELQGGAGDSSAVPPPGHSPRVDNDSQFFIIANSFSFYTVLVLNSFPISPSSSVRTIRAGNMNCWRRSSRSSGNSSVIGSCGGAESVHPHSVPW